MSGLLYGGVTPSDPETLLSVALFPTAVAASSRFEFDKILIGIDLSAIEDSGLPGGAKDLLRKILLLR
jgi:hypothetical protein